MTPARNNKPTDGAMRAAKQIEHNPSFLQSTAEIIDRETGVHELADRLNELASDELSSRGLHHNKIAILSDLSQTRQGSATEGTAHFVA